MMFSVELHPITRPDGHGVHLSDDVVRTVRAQAMWQDSPTGVNGRSAHVVCRPPIDTPWGPMPVIRSKGVAWTDSAGRVHPPSNQSWFATGTPMWSTCTVSGNGKVSAAMCEDRAQGAMPVGRAQQEIEGTFRAASAGVTTSLPVAWGRYPNLTFHGEPLGFLVFCEPGVINRLGSEMDARPHNLTEAAATLTGVGHALRQVHRAGMVNVSPHLGNFSVAAPALPSRTSTPQPTRVDLRVHDLDRFNDTAPMTVIQQVGYRLRDLAVAGWSLARRSYTPALRHLRHDLARHIMAGYVDDTEAVSGIGAVELIRFVGVLRNGGNVADIDGRWVTLVTDATFADLGLSADTSHHK